MIYVMGFRFLQGNEAVAVFNQSGLDFEVLFFA